MPAQATACRKVQCKPIELARARAINILGSRAVTGAAYEHGAVCQLILEQNRLPPKGRKLHASLASDMPMTHAQTMSETARHFDFDLAIIGGGSAGYAA